MGLGELVTPEAQRAALAWLISGAFQFASAPELSLASWEALLFFTLGTFLAAVGFGWLERLVTRAAAKLIARFPLSGHRPAEAQRVRCIGALIAFSTFATAFACASEVARSIQ